MAEVAIALDGASRYPETEDSQTVAQKDKDELLSPVYRSYLPVPKPNTDFSLWTILKDCVGKDLNTVSMPVYFNEPISMLQKVAECMEAVEHISEIANCTNHLEKIGFYLNIFLKGQHSQLYRDKKPFTPMVGETYELIEEEKKFRFFSEQISRYPPISAWRIDGKGFTSWGDIRPKVMFWGTYTDIHMDGNINVLLDSGECIVCNIPNTHAHNLIFGKFWSEKSGPMNIRNLMNKEVLHVDFKSSLLPGKSPHKVVGHFTDSNGKEMYKFKGLYIEKLLAKKGKDHPEKAKDNPEKVKHKKPKDHQDKSKDAANLQDKSKYAANLKDRTVIYTAPDINEDSYHEYYHFPPFSMILNQIFPGMEKTLPPTDSRFRRDIRALEEGRINCASDEKHRLEDKQLLLKKVREKSGKPWIPLWFELRENPYTHQQEWISNGKYWERNYQQCPDLF